LVYNVETTYVAGKNQLADALMRLTPSLPIRAGYIRR